MKKERNDKDVREEIIDNIVDNNGAAGEADSTLKEWDFTDDEEIQEFLSHDFDVVAESRRRIQNNQNRARRGRQDKNAKEKTVKEKPIREKAKNEKKQNEKRQQGNTVSFIDRVKALWDKWLELYHKNTMQILFGTLTGLVVMLVIAITATYPYGQGDEAQTSEQESSTEQEETTTANDEPTKEAEEPEILPETEDSAIHNLVIGYIDAAYIKADMEAVALVVDDTTNINVDSYKSRQKYIELYENVKCYKLESAIENAYIVFVTYDAKLYNIDTLIPAAETFIVKFNQTEGKFFIHNMSEAEKLDGYIAKGSQFEIINKMSADVVARLEQALKSDPELKEVYELMNNISSQATQIPQTPEEQSSSTEQTTPPAQQ